MILDIVMEQNNKRMRASVGGEIDASQRKILKSGLEEKILEFKPNVVIIDGENLDYIDSTGLGVLVSALKQVKEYGGNIQIINLKPYILKIFRITGLSDIFEIEG